MLLLLQVWMPLPHQFCGEPCFAPRAAATAASAEDDGYILTLVTDGRAGTCELVALDAAAVAAGPVARLDLGVNLPHGLHGCWAPDARPSAAELDDAKTLLRMYERKSQEWNQIDASFSGLGIMQFFGQKGVSGR